LKLMQPTPSLPAGHPLLSYCYSDTARWAQDEIEAFQQSLFRHGKDFRSVSKEVLHSSFFSKTYVLTFFFRHMREVIDNGYLYIAQPPLFKIARGKSAIYVKDESEREAHLISSALEDASLKLKNGEVIMGQDLESIVKKIQILRQKFRC